MPTLNHVYWKMGDKELPITANWAYDHFDSKISANREVFFCGLCREKVALCGGDIQEPHFRHSRAGANKECNERAIIRERNERNIPNEIKKYNSDCFFKELPLKLNKDQFEIGFPYIETDNYSELFYIIPEGCKEITYRFERLNNIGLTYLSVGKKIVPKYKISINDSKINKFIPKYVLGIYKDYTFFDWNCKKISYEGYISVDQNYYLLSRRYIENYYKDSIILNYKSDIDNYFLYEFKVINYNDEIKNFIHNIYSYNLQREELFKNREFIPLWSAYVKRLYFIALPDTEKVYDKLYFNKKNIDYNLYPKESASSIQDNYLNLFNKCKYNLLSFGFPKDYEFLTIMKKEFSPKLVEDLIVRVYDSSKDKKEVFQGVYYQLPFKRKLALKNPSFDGFVEILSNNGLVKWSGEFQAVDRKDELYDRFFYINDLEFDDTVNIYYGLDLVWSAKYEKKKEDKINDNTLFLELQKLTGKKISISHSIGIMTMKMKLYPKTKNWFLKQIRKGFIVDKAFEMLKKIFKGGDIFVSFMLR